MSLKTKLAIVLLFVSGLCGLFFSLYMHPNSDLPAVSGNDVQLIQTFHYPAFFVKQLEHDPRAGEKIYAQFCVSCHSPHPRIDINAPHVGDKKAWVEQRKWGKSALLKMTIEGVGAMPARGGCFECSDEQLRETIDYMLEATPTPTQSKHTSSPS